jgi:hypothetical protein
VLAELWGRARELVRPAPPATESRLDRCSIPDDDGLDPEATARADQMLRDELGPEYDRLMAQGFLDVPSTLFRNTTYRLRMRRPIEVFKGGRRQQWRLCVTPVERVPAADELLMKLVWLRANEEYVLTTANRVR